MAYKIGVVSLGCSKNQINTEIMISHLLHAGFEITKEPDYADVILINTCGFIEDAKSEAIENIIEMSEFKKQAVCKGIVVAGCLAERYRSEIFKEMPEVNAVIGVGSFDKVVDAVNSVLDGKQYEDFGDVDESEINGDRILTTPHYMAYLKIAEGCDNCCSYCMIPTLRGRFRSRSIEDILEEAKNLVSRGVKELILVAQDTTNYGIDLYGEYKLVDLLKELCQVEGLKWIRLHYLYPEKVNDELIDLIAKEDKILKYIDVPIQHASDKMLKAMNRTSAKKDLLTLFAKLKEKLPTATLRTTVIVGFPGEAKEDFDELLSFIKRIEFDHLGIFCYSREEGTESFDMEGQIDEKTKQKRSDILTSEQDKILLKKIRKMRGKTIEVLTEEFDRYANCYFGRSTADSPEVDGKVFFKSGIRLNGGDFVRVKITGALDYDLYGETV